jgi:hypothetical protein
MALKFPQLPRHGDCQPAVIGLVLTEGVYSSEEKSEGANCSQLPAPPEPWGDVCHRTIEDVWARKAHASVVGEAGMSAVL